VANKLNPAPEMMMCNATGIIKKSTIHHPWMKKKNTVNLPQNKRGRYTQVITLGW
jgi:hypothetical protein